jgi:hypothetical protein
MKAIKILILLVLFVSFRNVYAVAFKVQNDTEYTFGVRIFDRGSWRPRIICYPGFWGDVATSVERADHTVQIQILINNQWRDFYYGNHGSKMFTRIIQLVQSGHQMGIAWWDEPPGCRDQPPHPILRPYGSCLKSSGWYKSLIIKGVIWGVQTIITL